MSQGHRRKWGQRRQRVSGRPVDPGIRPKGGGGAGGGALEDSEQKSRDFIPFSPWGGIFAQRGQALLSLVESQ